MKEYIYFEKCKIWSDAFLIIFINFSYIIIQIHMWAFLMVMELNETKRRNRKFWDEIITPIVFGLRVLFICKLIRIYKRPRSSIKNVTWNSANHTSNLSEYANWLSRCSTFTGKILMIKAEIKIVDRGMRELQ